MGKKWVNSRQRCLWLSYKNSQVKTILFIQSNITNHKFVASIGITICAADGTLYPYYLSIRIRKNSTDMQYMWCVQKKPTQENYSAGTCREIVKIYEEHGSERTLNKFNRQAAMRPLLNHQYKAPCFCNEISNGPHFHASDNVKVDCFIENAILQHLLECFLQHKMIKD